MANESVYEKLEAGLRGRLIKPGDADYETRRQVYNAMIDKKPAAILQAANVSDVIAAVNFARDEKVLLAVRGGGHNAGGLGICDDGLVIDLGGMRGIRVDPRSGDLEATEIVDLLGNVTQVAFEGIETNVGPDPGLFTFKAPDGVELIELEAPGPAPAAP